MGNFFCLINWPFSEINDSSNWSLTAEFGANEDEAEIVQVGAEAGPTPNHMTSNLWSHLVKKILGAHLYNFGSILVGIEPRGQILK
jgi:hypothetical protein